MVDTPLPKYGTNVAGSGGDVNLLSNQQANGEGSQNSLTKLATSFAGIAHVISKSNTPSGTAESDTHMVGASGSGVFTGFTEDNLACLIDGAWHEVAAFDGLAIVREDLGNSIHVHDGVSWIEAPASVTDAITASATQTQGQQPLTARFNRVSSVGTANDVVTLPAAAPGLWVIVWNDDGTDALQVFPASGDSIDEGSVDASTSVTTGTVAHFYAINTVKWCSITG